MDDDKTVATLAFAQATLREKFHEGSDCPCCGQFVKLYKRRLNGSMVSVLVEIYKQDNIQSGFFHIEDHLKECKDITSAVRGDFPKLRYWGFIEGEEDKREDGSSRNGFWRITEKGKDFIKGKLEVKSHVFIFNNKCQGFSETTTTLRDCFGKDFNFNELMKGV